MDNKKTLSLNMIVGPGDASLVERFFNSISVLEKPFDEVVIVTTTADSAVIDVANKYGTSVYQKQWATKKYPYGDFAGARNVAIENSHCDYVMWIDADDVFNQKNLEKRWSGIRGILDTNEYDMLLMPYCLTESEDKKALNTILRERIFRRDTGLLWVEPVHEQLPWWDMEMRVQTISGDYIVTHKPEKVPGSGVIRNIKILQHEYYERHTRHSQYYLGRDLIAIDRTTEAIPILARYVDEFDGEDIHVFDACMDLCVHYLYEKCVDKVRLRTESIDIAERYAMIAMSIETEMAELWCYLGDIARDKGDTALAIRHYSRAMRTPFGKSGLVQRREYYEAIPAKKLSEIYHAQDKLEEALLYNKTALKHAPEDSALRKSYKEIAEKIFYLSTEKC